MRLGLLQEGQVVSRVQGGRGLGTRGNTPDISTSAHFTARTETFYWRENSAEPDSPSRRAMTDQLSTVQPGPPANYVLIQTDTFDTSPDYLVHKLQTTLSGYCSAQLTVITGLQDFLSSELRAQTEHSIFA